MKKYEIWESIVILLSAIVLLPFWLSRTGQVQFPPTISSILEIVAYPLLIVLVVILLRRFRRIMKAFRETETVQTRFHNTLENLWEF